MPKGMDVGAVHLITSVIAAAILDINAALDINLNGQMSYPIADALAAHGVPFALSTGYDRDRLPDNYRTFPVLQKPF